MEAPSHRFKTAMSDTKVTIVNRPTVLTPSAGDSAGGVSTVKDLKSVWYIFKVKNNTELVSAGKVSKGGYKTYVPTQTEARVNSRGQCKVTERRILPSTIFVYATDKERVLLLKTFPFLYKSIEDPARRDSYGKAQPAYVTEEEIERLQFMLFKAEKPVTFDSAKLKKGSKIRVIRGALANLEGYLVEDATALYVAVNISILGSAKTEINRNDVEQIQ